MVRLQPLPEEGTIMPVTSKPYGILFNFAATVVLKGHQKEQNVAVTAEVPVMIRHAGGDDAPVAAVHRGPPDASGKQKEKRYRLWDGGMVHTPLAKFKNPETQKTYSARITASAIERSAAGPNSSVTAPLRPTLPHADRVITLREHESCRRHVGDDRLTREREIRRLAAAAVFIDGVLHVSSAGSAWHVDVARYGGAPVTLRAIPDLPAVHSDYAWIYRGDRHAEALAVAEGELARLVAADPERGGCPVAASGEIDVLLPDAFVFDEAWAFLGQAARTVVPAMGPAVWQWSMEDLAHFVALRDAAASWPPVRDPAIVEAARRVGRHVRHAHGVWEKYCTDFGAMVGRISEADARVPPEPAMAAPPGP